MSADNNSSAANSVTTPKSAPNKPPAIDDAQFLAEQAQHAKAAIGQVLREMGEDLKGGVDVRHWTQQYPLITLGVAAVAGFAAAAAIVPGADQTWEAKFESLKKTLARHTDPPHDGNGASAPAAESPRPAKPSWVSEILRETAKVLGPALALSLKAAISPRNPAPQEPPADSTDKPSP